MKMNLLSHFLPDSSEAGSGSAGRARMALGVQGRRRLKVRLQTNRFKIGETLLCLVFSAVPWPGGSLLFP